MYLFSRRARLANGNARKAMNWALDITERATQTTGLEFSLYAQVLSPEVGTMVWSTFLPDLATFEAATDKLNVDDAYLAVLDEGASFMDGGADDGLTQLVHGEMDPTRRVEYVTVNRAVCATGQLTRGVAIGIGIAQQAEKISGVPTLFALDVTGSYGAVSWFTGHDNIGSMEAAEQKLMADPSWAESIDRETAGVYVESPELTTQLIYRRLS